MHISERHIASRLWPLIKQVCVLYVRAHGSVLTIFRSTSRSKGSLFLPNKQQVTFEKVEIAGRRPDWNPLENISNHTPTSYHLLLHFKTLFFF